MEQVYVNTKNHYTECKIDVSNNFDSQYKILIDVITNDKIVDFLNDIIKMNNDDNTNDIDTNDWKKQREKSNLMMFNKLKENPIMLFSECCSEYCALTRKINNMRKRFEDYFLDKMNKCSNKDNSELVITFYGSGYFLQELIIITKLKQLGYHIGTINLIEIRFGEYLECMKNDDNVFNVTNNDTNIERSLWLSSYTLRLYHFMNYLNYIGVNSKVNMFSDSINIIKSNTVSNIFMGIDYIDDGFTDIAEFHYVAMSTTDGICASIISHNMIEIYKNKPNNEVAKQYFLTEIKCNDLKEKAEKEVTRVKLDEMTERNKYNEYILSSEGYYGVNYTENYKNIKKQMDELNTEYNKYILNYKKDSIFSGDFNKFILYGSINKGLKLIGVDKIINYF